MKNRKHIHYILSLTFLIGIHRGRIAIWHGEDPEPECTLPYSASLLPEADRKALEKGIYIQSREELTQIIEDFCS